MNATTVSRVLLKLSKPLQDEIVTDSGLKFYLDPTYNKNWQATVTATIAALPTKVNPKHKAIADNLKVGDEVCISYMVVSDLDFGSDSKNFMPVTEGNDLMREWINGYGEKLRVYALPGKISKIWVGLYQDKGNQLISGVQGTESEMNRWLAQFSIGKTDVYSFNNFFEYGGEDYWKCDLDDIFAKKVDGHIVAVGDRVIMKPVEEEVPAEVKNSLGYDGDVKVRYQDRGRLISGGKSKGLKKDEVLHFNSTYLEKYEFFNKQYYLIHENRVEGKFTKPKPIEN